LPASQITNLQKLQNIFLTQAGYCDELGSPFMVRLCRLFAEHLDEDDPFAHRLLELPQGENLWNIALPLRVAGALHALVLTKQCQELERVYPPHHDDHSDSELWAACLHAMDAHADFVIPYLDQAPQTNEVRRCAALLPGFLTIAKLTGLPFIMSELGASAGLNLSWDSFGYKLNNQTWGDLNSGVVMEPEWLGAAAPEAIEITVINRAGCDLSPIDSDNPGERLKLLSYLWADQHDRVSRTDNAMAIVKEKNYCVETADISDWLIQRLGMDSLIFESTGAVHVIYHSIVWGYQDETARLANQRQIENAGLAATPKSPLAWLRLEPDGSEPGAAITLTLWPEGRECCLGRADYHGRWIDWSGWED
jgi:hypothetical protein